MEFVKEFAVFLHKSGAIRFGDFAPAGGKGRRSPFRTDLGIVQGHPVEFRRMVKALQNMIADEIGLDGFDSLAAVTAAAAGGGGGLVIASALAIETVKPIICVRGEGEGGGVPKGPDAAKAAVEGKIGDKMRAVMVGGAAATGGTVIEGIRALRESGAEVTDACVIVDTLEGAAVALGSEGVTMHRLTDVLQIAEILHGERSVSDEVLDRVRSHAGTDY